VARIRFCISESLLGVITGEVGVGKTVAVRAATSQLDATAHHIIYAKPTLWRAWAVPNDRPRVGAKPQRAEGGPHCADADVVGRRGARAPRRVVVIIDEAHLLALDQLEELRLLTNPEMD
jgi:type II secretory pathway predicted ATPase ExeA